jgi:UDP-N-acetylglucosamine 2-epimerase (non-hydrolysing)
MYADFMRLLSIVGARPHFVKLAPISWAAKERVEHKILHTGQHYDAILSDSFFQILGIPEPDFQLNVGSGLHGQQTGSMIMGIEEILLQEKPDHVLVYGDTNTTLAGAIAASKLNIPLSHVEAGLRSFNDEMPEEVNRVLTDHCSTLLFAPTATALNNLKIEGLVQKSFLSGDVTVETLNHIRKGMKQDEECKDYFFATIHRAENTADEARISYIVGEMRKSSIPIHLHCHPRLKNALDSYGIGGDSETLRFLPPLDYISTIKKISGSLGVITDSGGVQKESFILHKPCMVIRSETEWVETLQSGSNFLDPNLLQISSDWWVTPQGMDSDLIFGTGQTAKLIIDEILAYSSRKT